MPEPPSGTSGTSQPGEISIISDSIRRWVAARCVPFKLCASNPRILHREFLEAGGAKCSEGAFVGELRGLGFALDADGMVAGLALGIDFIAATDYECARCPV